MRRWLLRLLVRLMLRPVAGGGFAWVRQIAVLNLAIAAYGAVRLFSGFSEAIAEKTLGHMWGKTSFTMPAELFLALLTSVPTASSTGESVESTEATYTGYVRLKLDLTKFKLTKAATAVIENELELTFAACTGAEKTVTAWATTEKKRAEACNIVMWGTATSTVISATQTPPVIAAKTLRGELK
jgi:hypothetical protein